MILAICNNPEVLTIMKYVKLVMDLIRIIVPIALIIAIMVSLIGVITGKADDELPKVLKSSVNKILAAVLVFLVPTFVNIVFEVMEVKSVEFATCLANATDENITLAYNKQAESYVAVVNTSLLRGDYNVALSKVNNLKDESEKKELKAQLEDIEKKITEKEEKDRKNAQIKGKGAASYGGYVGDGLVYPLGDFRTVTTTCYAAVDSLHSLPHGGLDLAAGGIGGKPIYAAADGKVTFARDTITYGCGADSCKSLGCGNYVTIDHGDGVSTSYCHMQYGSVKVKTGDTVVQGQQIGSVGSTGHSSGNHLHFEVAKNGSRVNPAQQLIYNADDTLGCGLRTK